MLKGAEANNITTMLAFYEWRDSVYFVFPYVELDLYTLLRKNSLPNRKKTTQLNGAPLREHWLWEQMCALAVALSAIHTSTKLPYERIQGKLNICHYDLKPQNILVTNEGVLKITDFGASAIRRVLSADDKSTPYRTGDPKYAAPESLRVPGPDVLDRASDNYLKPIMPLLNYDVWALACVMTEVLVVLLSNGLFQGVDTPVDQLHIELTETSSDLKTSGTFLEGTAVKNCVLQRIKGFRRHRDISQEYPQSRYMQAICDLLLQMFKSDNKLRPFSDDVVVALDAAATQYRTDCADQGDQLAVLVRNHDVGDNTGFKEVGWRHGASVRSFLMMLVHSTFPIVHSHPFLSKSPRKEVTWGGIVHDAMAPPPLTYRVGEASLWRSSKKTRTKATSQRSVGSSFFIDPRRPRRRGNNPRRCRSRNRGSHRAIRESSQRQRRTELSRPSLF